MPVTSVPDYKIIKIKYDCGEDLMTGKRKYRNKSYGSIKSAATNDKIMTFINTVSGLQQDTLSGSTLIAPASLQE